MTVSLTSDKPQQGYPAIFYKGPHADRGVIIVSLTVPSATMVNGKLEVTRLIKNFPSGLASTYIHRADSSTMIVLLKR